MNPLKQKEKDRAAYAELLDVELLQEYHDDPSTFKTVLRHDWSTNLFVRHFRTRELKNWIDIGLNLHVQAQVIFWAP